jgi:hypothetical protein
MMEFTPYDKKMAKTISLALTITRGISEIAGKDCIYYPLNSLQPLIDLLDKIGEEEPEQKEEPVNRMRTTYTTMLTQEDVACVLAKTYGVQPKNVVIKRQSDGTVCATISGIPGEV